VAKAHEASALREKGETVWDWMILALASQRANEPNEAKKWAARVEEWFAQPREKRRSHSGRPLVWYEHVELETLHAELRTTLGLKE
jgi:hypothetical protein